MTVRETAVLRLEGVGVRLPDRGDPGGEAVILDGVGLRVEQGQVVVLLGPSGAGKSTLVAALLGLLPEGARVEGHAWWGPERTAGVDLLAPGRGERDRLRRDVVAWLPQVPSASMTPVLSVGHHLREKARLHTDRRGVPALVGRALLRYRAEESWTPRLPGELSGGQLRRVSNALHLLGDPALVLADEPTSGLDRELTARVGEELRALAHDEGRAVLVVTHDLALARQIADEVVELDEGQIGAGAMTGHLHGRVSPPVLEPGPRRLPDGQSSGGGPQDGPTSPGLVAEGLSVARGHGRGRTTVLTDVDLTVVPGRTVGLMAPSGYGKTSLLRTLALLHRPAAGRVLLEGREVASPTASSRVPAHVRRRIGYLPQDPRSAVNPRWTIGRIVAEPLVLDPGRRRGRGAGAQGRERDTARVVALLERVGLSAALLDRHPDEVSGGQLQRVGLARALALDPDYLLLDEPTSMVDAVTARSVMAVIAEQQLATGCGVLVASHDEDLISTWCDRVVSWGSPPRPRTAPDGR